MVYTVGGGVTRVPVAPTGLGFLAAGNLALGFTAGSLAVADSRVRIEPPQADPAGFLPGIGHLPSSSAVQMAHFWRAQVGRFSRAPKRRCFVRQFSTGPPGEPGRSDEGFAARVPPIRDGAMATAGSPPFAERTAQLERPRPDNCTLHAARLMATGTRTIAAMLRSADGKSCRSS